MAHFRGIPLGPPTFWVPPADPPSCIPAASPNEPAHIPIEGRGTCGFEVHGWESGGVARTKGGSGMRELNPTSSVDAVDVEFRLRPHAQ